MSVQPTHGPVTAAELPNVVRRRSSFLVRWFLWYLRGYFPRHFHSVSLSRAGGIPVVPQGPLVVVLNHPSWWDPLLCAVLTPLFPDRAVYAPIESASLVKYRFFERLGFFGIDPGTAVGARTFLRLGTEILNVPGTALWLTAQGQFTDPRQRPPGLRAGVAHLVRRLRGATVLPLAVEYPFWNERLPEALARFGEPIPVDDGRALTAEAWLKRIETGLSLTQDALAEEARTRDAALFDSILTGRTGVGGIYDLWRCFRARSQGQAFDSRHASIDTRNHHL